MYRQNYVPPIVIQQNNQTVSNGVYFNTNLTNETQQQLYLVGYVVQTPVNQVNQQQLRQAIYQQIQRIQQMQPQTSNFNTNVIGY